MSDLNYFKFLGSYFSHDRVQFLKVIGLAVESLEGGISKVIQACDEKNEKLLKDGFHTLKGNLTNLELGYFLDKMPKYDHPALFEISKNYIHEIELALNQVKSNIPDS